MSDAALKSAKAVSNFTSVAVEKPEPLMTTCVPGFPTAGVKLVTVGAASAINRLNRKTQLVVPAARKLPFHISLFRVQNGFLCSRAFLVLEASAVTTTCNKEFSIRVSKILGYSTGSKTTAKVKPGGLLPAKLANAPSARTQNP